jgi:hypothetical protein
MANWHICEDPYPGPARVMTIAEAFRTIQLSTSLFTSAIEEAKRVIDETWGSYKSLWVSSWSNIEPLPKTEWAYGPYFDNSLMFHSSMTEEERREHALKCRQNRNTGPRRDFTYHHDGRRRI